MFDKRSGIEAVVLPIRSGDPNTDPYHEWTAPTKLELHRKNALQYGPNVAFITPDVGDQFSIKVFVHPITNFVQQPEIHVTCTIDGLAYTSCNGTIQKIPEAARDGPPLSVVLDSTVLTTNGEKQWCSFNFSRLKLNNSLEIKKKEAGDKISGKRGKIQVTVQRGRSTFTKRDPGTQTPKNYVPLRKDLSREAAKALGSMLYTQFTPIKAAGLSIKKTIFIPGKDKAGEEIKFTFCYTCPKYLQATGITPPCQHHGEPEQPIVIDDSNNDRADQALPRPPQGTSDPKQEDVSVLGARPAPNHNARINSQPKIKSEPGVDAGVDQQLHKDQDLGATDDKAAPHTMADKNSGGNEVQRTVAQHANLQGFVKSSSEAPALTKLQAKRAMEEAELELREIQVTKRMRQARAQYEAGV